MVESCINDIIVIGIIVLLVHLPFVFNSTCASVYLNKYTQQSEWQRHKPLKLCSIASMCLTDIAVLQHTTIGFVFGAIVTVKIRFCIWRDRYSEDTVLYLAR